MSDSPLHSFLRVLLKRPDCAELRACEKNQSRDVCPEQQTDRYVKRSVERFQVQMWQHGHESLFRNQPGNSRDNRGSYDLTGRNFSVGQNPVDREEKQDRCEPGGRGQPQVANSLEDEILSVVKEDESQKLPLPGTEQDTSQSQKHH